MLVSSGAFEFSDEGDRAIADYIRSVYEKYGVENVLHQNIVYTSASRKMYLYHTVRVNNDKENID